MNKSDYSLIGFLAIIALFICSCKKDDDKDPSKNGNPQTQEALLYFRATLDNVKYDYSIYDGSEPYEISSNSSASIGSGGSQSTFIYGSGSSDTETGESFNIALGTLVIEEGGRPDYETFKHFVINANYRYSVDAKNGIEIVFWDKDGKEWSTSNGDQTKSDFKVVSITERTLFGESYIEIVAAFNCTLYDENGNFITLKDGSSLYSVENI